jgi:hypothetical protein
MKSQPGDAPTTNGWRNAFDRLGAARVRSRGTSKRIIIIMNTTYVPLISSGVAGPLGVLHLPRLWLKVSLEAQGKLATGYPGIGQGYDMMVINALGLSPDAVKMFINEKRPTYPEFEAWVKQQPGVQLDKASVDKLNAGIQGYVHDDATRKGILSANGLPDDGSVHPGAVTLNNLDDWYEFHQAALK